MKYLLDIILVAIITLTIVLPLMLYIAIAEWIQGETYTGAYTDV